MQFCKVEPQTGLFIEDAILDAPPLMPDGTPDPSYIADPVPPGLYWPKRDLAAGVWVEGGTPPEPVAPTPTLEERLAAVEAATLDLILGGVV